MMRISDVDAGSKSVEILLQRLFDSDLESGGDDLNRTQSAHQSPLVSMT